MSRSDSTCIMQSDWKCLPLLKLRVLRLLQTLLRLETLARTRLDPVLSVLIWAIFSALHFDLLTSAQRKRGSTSREYPQYDKNFLN